MKGHIRERSPGHWAIILDAQDATGKRKRRWHSFVGTKRQAQIECARFDRRSRKIISPLRLLTERFAWAVSCRCSGSSSRRLSFMTSSRASIGFLGRLVLI